MGRRAGISGPRRLLAVIVVLVLTSLAAAGQVDLRIANATVLPEIVDQGETTILGASITAVGLTSGDPVTVRIAIRRVDLEEECCYSERVVPIQQLRSGYQLEELIDTASREPGTYEVTIAVDPTNSVAEDVETNNRVVLFLQVLALRPELHPLRLALEPPSPVDRGTAVSMTTVIENSGHRNAGGFSVRFSLFPVLSTSEEATRQFSAATSGGAFDSTVAENGSDISFEGWFEETGRHLSDDAWIPFWSANVSGLDLSRDVVLTSVLPTGQGLRDLLVPGHLSASEMALLQEGTTVYAVRVVVDPVAATDSFGSVAEEDENNNVLFGVLTIRPSKLALPELTVQTLRLDGPLPLEWGDRQDVTLVVANTGGSPAPVGSATPAPQVQVEVLYRMSGGGSNEWQSLGTVTVATTGDRLGIEEGNNTVENNDVTIDVEDIPLLPGSYELKAVVDPQDQIEEQNESNNELAIGFSVEGGELHPTSILVASDELRQGGSFSLSTSIRNTGRRTLTSFVVAFFLDDVRFDTFYYYESLTGDGDGGLAEDETAWAQGVLDTEGVAPGDYMLRVVVDPDNAIPEMDEENNEMSRPVTILPRDRRQPELVATSIAVDPSSPVEQATNLSVDVEVLNRGTLDATGFQVALEIQHESASEWTRVGVPTGGSGLLVPALARGGRTVLGFDILASELAEVGTYRMRAIVDAASQLDELDEENNALEVAFWVGPPEAGSVPPSPYANLVFKSLEVSPTQNVDAREQISIQSLVIWNAGLEAAGPFDVSFCWRTSSGACTPAVGTARVSGLVAEGQEDFASAFAPVEAPVTPGSYQLVATVDSSGEVDEHGRELDNTAYATVQVTGMVKADLTIERLWLAPEAPFEIGQDVRAYARILNRSRDVAAGPFDVRFEQTEGGPVHDVSVARLGPNASLDVSFDVSTSAVGEFSLSVTADVKNTVLESDDNDATNNNVAQLSFTVAEVPGVPVSEVVSINGAVRSLTNDPSSGTLYAASASGRVVAFRHSDAKTLLFDVSISGDVVGLALVPGVALYVGTEGGSIYALNLATGAEENEIVLPNSLALTCMRAGIGGVLYIGTTDGVLALDSAGALLSGSMPSGPVIDLGIDPLDGSVHAATESSVYTLDPQLVLQCVYTGIPGTHTSLAAGPGTLYVGTEEGAVFAYSRCAGSWMWRYPANGLLGSPVTSVLVDPSDIDPVYVTTQDGRLISLDLFGAQRWIHTASAALEVRPVWDGRTGRVFAVDADGTPFVLNASGGETFPIDASASAGAGASSSLAVGEYLTGSGSSARVMRVYYYGGDDGVVYVIRTDR